MNYQIITDENLLDEFISTFLKPCSPDEHIIVVFSQEANMLRMRTARISSLISKQIRINLNVS
jgi:hypothetical protein